jgi:hypothetical protein
MDGFISLTAAMHELKIGKEKFKVLLDMNLVRTVGIEGKKKPRCSEKEIAALKSICENGIFPQISQTPQTEQSQTLMPDEIVLKVARTMSPITHFKVYGMEPLYDAYKRMTWTVTHPNPKPKGISYEEMYKKVRYETVQGDNMCMPVGYSVLGEFRIKDYPQRYKLFMQKVGDDNYSLRISYRLKGDGSFQGSLEESVDLYIYKGYPMPRMSFEKQFDHLHMGLLYPQRRAELQLLRGLSLNLVEALDEWWAKYFRGEVCIEDLGPVSATDGEKLWEKVVTHMESAPTAPKITGGA